MIFIFEMVDLMKYGMRTTEQHGRVAHVKELSEA